MNSGIHARYALQRGRFRLDVDLDLPLCGIIGVFGASGAGKTSLLRCIAGLERPAAGKLVVAGDVWQDDATNAWRAVHERDQRPGCYASLDKLSTRHVLLLSEAQVLPARLPTFACCCPYRRATCSPAC